MSQFPLHQVPQALDARSVRKLIPYGLTAIVLIAVVVAVIASQAAHAVQDGSGPSTRAASGDLTDGYLAGAIAANAAAQAGSGELVTDGWAAGLVGSAQGQSLRGGWEARITPSTTATTQIRDGWEARLVD